MKRLIILLVVLFSVIHAKDTKKSVSVMEFKANGVEKHIATQITSAFSSKLVETGKFKVLDRD